MSPERHPAARNDSDGSSGGGGCGGGGGGGTVIGGHVTVESLSVSGSNSGQLDASPSVGSSMVLSSIPLEANQVILQQHLAHQHQQSQQQQHHIIASGNGSSQSSTNSSGSAISAASSIGSNHSIIINNNTSFKNHNNIIISGSSNGSNSSSNNHTYTINLSASHNGHAVLANGTGSIPIHTYAQPSVTGATSVNGSHSSHHLGQAFHHQLLHPVPNSAPSATLISASSMATGHSNGLTTASTTVVAPTPQTSQPTAAVPSKLVLLQQGHLGENYITTTDGMNGVGNIVLLATEQMDMSSAEHDLLNNNVIITSSGSNGSSGGHGSSHIIGHSYGGSNHNHQHNSHHHPLRNGTTTVLTASGGGVVVNADEELTPLTWLHDKNLLKGINLSKVPVSSPDSPSRHVGGHLSPTSDFVEDSSVSEDNTSSANSSSDQSIGVYCTETIHPSGRPVPVGTTATGHHTFQLANGNQRTIATISGETIVEYPVISSEEKELKSPSSTVSCASSSSPPSSSSSLYNSSHSPASSTGQIAPPAAHSGSNSGGSTPHQHFHKKYLREEHVKQLKQVSSSYVTPIKQQSSAIKYEEGEIVDERPYPSAPVKNGYQMAVSPAANGNSDDYSSTYGAMNSMKPPSSPPLSPQHMNGSGSIAGIHPLVPPPSLGSPQLTSVSSGQHSPAKLSPPKAKHPTNVPYDPQVHVHSKPPFSFSSLIFMAIENCQQKALPVKEIYAWIVHHFPYFKTAPTGWKNSVRHNLSLNKCFQKVEKAANLGKGSLWMVEPQYRPNLIQALSRSPFHSGSGIDKTTYKAMQAQHQQQQQQHQRSTDSPTSSVGSSYSKDNFPYLASRLAPGESQNGAHGHHLHGQHHPDLDGDDFSRSSTPIDYDGDLPQPSSGSGSGPYHVTYHHHHHGGPPPPESLASSTFVGSTSAGGMSAVQPSDATGRDWSADTIDDVNAATAMLALKHGPKIFTEGFQNGTPPVITTSPSEDHTYSAGGGIQTSGASGHSSQANSDNNSNGTSSDAAYESSEESQNLPAAEDLEEQRRQAGVDALLNLAGITDYSTSSTTIQSLKRPVSTPYDSGHQSPYQAPTESTPPSGYSSVVVSQPVQPPFRNYYMPDDLSQYSSPSPPKKSKPSSARMLKKFKKKASWVR